MIVTPDGETVPRTMQVYISDLTLRVEVDTLTGKVTDHSLIARFEPYDNALVTDAHGNKHIDEGLGRELAIHIVGSTPDLQSTTIEWG